MNIKRKIASGFPVENGARAHVLNQLDRAFTSQLGYRNNGKFVFDDGNIVEYRLAGLLHNKVGPSLITPLIQIWCKRGRIHRKDGPAIILSNGEQFYFLNNKMYSPGIYFIMYYKWYHCKKPCRRREGA